VGCGSSADGAVYIGSIGSLICMYIYIYIYVQVEEAWDAAAALMELFTRVDGRRHTLVAYIFYSLIH
jgi:hypothetical protein